MVTVKIKLVAILIAGQSRIFTSSGARSNRDHDCQKQVSPRVSAFVFNSDSFRQLLQNPNNYIVTTDRSNHDVWLQT